MKIFCYSVVVIGSGVILEENGLTTVGCTVNTGN